MDDDKEIQEMTKEGEWLQAFPSIAELRNRLTRELSLKYVEERRSGLFE